MQDGVGERLEGRRGHACGCQVLWVQKIKSLRGVNDLSQVPFLVEHGAKQPNSGLLDDYSCLGNADVAGVVIVHTDIGKASRLVVFEAVQTSHLLTYNGECGIEG